MATILSVEERDCECAPGCPTSATITTWDCGCVQVEIHNDRTPCSGCSDFSSLRHHCGGNGSPREDD